MDRANLLFVLVDCLRSRAFFDESRGADIPTFRSLFERSVVFPETIATATMTSPSMATLFTGTLPFVHGVRSLRGHALVPEVATLAEVLRDNGFRTHAEATGPVVEAAGFDRGFDVFRRRPANRETLYRGGYFDRLQNEVFGSLRSSGQPWFLYLHQWELHRPRHLPKRYDDKRYGTHRYERALSALDQERLGRILELAGDDTVVVITGDHGETLPRYGLSVKLAKRFSFLKDWVEKRAMKGHPVLGHGYHVYEDLVRVPLVLHGPGVPQGRQVDASVRHMDVFPTLLDVLGVDDERARQGSGGSLRPYFDGHPGSRPGYSEAVGVGWPEDRWIVSVRDDGWKYVERGPAERWLWKLPSEKGNLVDREPDRATRMRAQLDQWLGGRDIAFANEPDLTADETAEMEAHLKDLGYLE
jgi:arylsulfatase A-like enzyme